MNHLIDPYRVLIVDDLPTVREALRWAFENISDLAIVGEADNGLMALQQAAALRPDVVVLDIQLPKLDGYAVAQSLKALAQPPIVIFLTIHSDDLSRRRGLAIGVDGFVEKSAGWASLIAQIRTALDERME